MSLDILEILFKLDYFVCLLIGFPLNILLIILIIFKTPKEMKTHSRILIQNCVLDILILINQMFLQVYYILDGEGNTIDILPNGILLDFMKENFDPNIKINFRRYLFMVSILLFVQLFYILEVIFFLLSYSNGGIKYFDNFNKTLPFIQYNMETMNVLSLLPTALIEIFAYLIIFICGFKMVRYVDLNTNLDGNLKRLNKLLTKVLIILALVPFVFQAGVLFFVIYSKNNQQYNKYYSNIISNFLSFNTCI
uniref:Uncharacterized protein n=1 Tax=Meloidogyne enterolobii TaxID=390850 RepID=A0A6V7XK71_MELEN|nr:unnamed protein product [Meloidogyne enterolobii]